MPGLPPAACAGRKVSTLPERENNYVEVKAGAGSIELNTCSSRLCE